MPEPTLVRPSFIRLEMRDDGGWSLKRVANLLELIREHETPEWRPNQVLFIDFLGGQHDPDLPVHKAPAVKAFLERLPEDVGVHVSFVGYPRGFGDLTEEAMAMVTLRPIEQILGQGGAAKAFHSLCQHALRDLYPNTERLFGAHATQLLGFFPLARKASAQRPANERLDALNLRLTSGYGMGELTSRATVYRGNVGYFSVLELEVGGTMRKVIAFCGDDGYPRIVTHLPLTKNARPA